MKYRLMTLFLLLLIVVPAGLSQSQPVGTLTPPTPIPTTEPANLDILPSQSTIARIQANGILRVGVLYNEPPFGELNVRGEVVGYDADVARALAEAWGVEIEFVQVTRQNRIEQLQRGDVDLLIAEMVHSRELDSRVEFSQTYYVGSQSVMVRADDTSIAALVNLANRRVGYVLATPSERAIQDWMNETAVPLQLQPYLTLDQAYAALFGGDVDAVIARESHLRRVAAGEPDATKLLPEVILREPYGIVMLRQDVNLRNLVNRTLQFLLQDKGIGQASTLEALYTQYFRGEEFPFDALPIYKNVGATAPTLTEYATDIPFPQGYAAPRILSNGVLRVAGQRNTDGMSEGQARIVQANISLVEQLALRWGVRVEWVDGDAISLVESGQADLAVGIAPDWNLSNRVDFSQPYLLHGQRLLIPKNRDFERFGDLRGRVIATIAGDGSARATAEAWASSINVNVRFFETTPDGVARTLLDDRNADVVYGDSLLILPFVQSNPNDLGLGPRWYSRDYLTMAIPRNDIDFQRLVNYTLQEMAQDQSLATILLPFTPPDEAPLSMDIWTGSSQYLNLNLGR